MESKKYIQVVSITKKRSILTDIQIKLVVYHGGRQYKAGGMRGANYWV